MPGGRPPGLPVITGSKDLDQSTVSSEGAAELWMSQMALNYVAQVAWPTKTASDRCHVALLQCSFLG